MSVCRREISFNKSLHNLPDLDRNARSLFDYYHIHDEVLMTLTNKLENVTADGIAAFIHNLVSIPQLKKPEPTFNPYITNPIISHLAEMKRPQKLLVADIDDITSDGVRAITERPHTPKYVNIEYCYAVDDSTIEYLQSAITR
ncbi:hypothetical protein BJV82DRAFT_673292 [Fennellomyces sp. T-0311]|nr:hypothetical protein BJV82DRAFT_673292 [Fennellomyces sp. T-0311]